MKDAVILLVEDNPDDEALTLRALHKNRVSNPVIIVHDGVEALEFLFGEGIYAGRNIADLPAVILLDLKLPRLDGLEVLRRLRMDERTSVIPVVVLTTSNEDKDILNSYALGANSYVRKPVDFDQFTEAVGKLGMYWLLVNEPPSSPVKLTR
jgi:CheY-like chemotaxis protein